MKKLSELHIKQDDSDHRCLELWCGDLVDLPASNAVDILVVSAREGSYRPSPKTLIRALWEKDISLEALAKDKLFDYRDSASCWLSKPIQSNAPGIYFKQILCFEPKKDECPEDVVDGIFRSLVPFVCGKNPLQNVAMPLVSTGRVARDTIDMMDALFGAAVKWLENGLPLKRLLIVENDESKALIMQGAFEILKKRYHKTVKPAASPMYDIFISYSHQNTEQMRIIEKELKQLRPGLRIFIDRLELQPGMAWQEMLFRSIDSSRKVIALYSPPYLDSANCLYEYNIARVLHIRSKKEILFPIFLYSTQAPLPPHMSEWQYEDCCEADEEKLRKACKKLVEQL